MSETPPEISVADLEQNHYEDPDLLKVANGDLSYLELLVKERIAAKSLYHDCYNSDKLNHFTLQRGAVLVYEHHLQGQDQAAAEQPPTTD